MSIIDGLAPMGTSDKTEGANGGASLLARQPQEPVDHEGEVLESFASKTRNKAAALKFMKKLMKRHGKAKAITTDGLRSYKAAMKEIGNADLQEVDRWANNRVENSHLPFR